MSDPAPGKSFTPPAAAERISFFDEQSRRRTQAKVWAWVALAVAWLFGWVLGFLVLVGVLFYTLLLSSFLPRPLANFVKHLVPNSQAVTTPLMVGALFFAVALWAAVRIIFGRDTSAAFLGRLNARVPDLSDPEEKQLVNVVEEMAIAAAAPPPAVKLYDGEAINAAALGYDAGHVTLLISRRMLNTLDRDETQGVIGHLIASAANGDLSLTAEMLRVFYVLGLAVTILDLPFSRPARGAFGALLALVFRARGAEEDREAVAARLTESLQPEGIEAMTRCMQSLMKTDSGSSARKLVGALILMPLLPLIMIRLAAALLYGLLSLFVLGPLVALLLRSRRRLADATAVQLTRNPDGLACALVHLVSEAHTIANAGWSEMLFIVGPEAAGARRAGRLHQRMSAIREMGGDWKTRSKAGLAASREFSTASDAPNAAAKHNFIFGFHPSLDSRIAQLKRMGATKVPWEVRKDYSGWIIAAVVVIVLGFVALLAFAS